MPGCCSMGSVAVHDRALGLPTDLTEDMSVVRDAWFSEVGSQPIGNRREQERTACGLQLRACVRACACRSRRQSRGPPTGLLRRQLHRAQACRAEGQLLHTYGAHRAHIYRLLAPIAPWLHTGACMQRPCVTPCFAWRVRIMRTSSGRSHHQVDQHLPCARSRADAHARCRPLAVAIERTMWQQPVDAGAISERGRKGAAEEMAKNLIQVGLMRRRPASHARPRVLCSARACESGQGMSCGAGSLRRQLGGWGAGFAGAEP